MGIWERDEGIRTAVEAGLGELAAEVRAGRHPAELAGARLELLTVCTGGTGLGRRGGRPLRDGAAARHGGPLARALNARQAVSYGTSPGIPSPFPAWRGTGCAWPSSGSWSPWAGRWWSSRSWCSPSLPAPPPALSGRRGHSAAPGCAAGGAAGAAPLPGVRPAKRPRNRAVPGPSSSRKDFRLDARLLKLPEASKVV